MPRYTIRAIFVIILLVSLASAVLFAFPDWLKILSLLISVFVLPGPLLVGWRRGGRLVAAFSLGGLIAYTAWFLMMGIPIGWQTVRYYSDIYGMTLTTLSLAATPNVFPVSLFSVFGGLYAPWIAVITSGLASMFLEFALGPRDEKANEDSQPPSTSNTPTSD